MSDRHLRPSSALAGVAIPGRYGKASGEPGVIIQERSGLGLATVAARKGQAAALRASRRRRLWRSSFPTARASRMDRR